MSSRRIASTASNRRRFHRRDTSIPATLEADGRSYEGEVNNLSLNGCLFNPPPALPPDTRVRIWVRGRRESMSGKVVMTSERGLHCQLSVATPKLAQLSTELDDMALLLLGATRERPPRAPETNSGTSSETSSETAPQPASGSKTARRPARRKAAAAKQAAIARHHAGPRTAAPRKPAVAAKTAPAAKTAKKAVKKAAKKAVKKAAKKAVKTTIKKAGGKAAAPARKARPKKAAGRGSAAKSRAKRRG